MGSVNGKIKRLVSDKGFGFVAAQDGTEYFFHQSACVGVAFDSLREGSVGHVRQGPGPQGSPRRKRRTRLTTTTPTTDPTAFWPLARRCIGRALATGVSRPSSMKEVVRVRATSASAWPGRLRPSLPLSCTSR